MATAVAGLVLSLMLVGCSGAASPSLPSVPLIVPSINPSAIASAGSAVASAGTQAALAALDQVDAAITASQSGGALTADDATSLKALTASVRTAVQSGDMTAARSAIDALSAKIGAMASTLNTDQGKLLSDAVSALKAALQGG
jgi:hypothetical protein